MTAKNGTRKPAKRAPAKRNAAAQQGNTRGEMDELRTMVGAIAGSVNALTEQVATITKEKTKEQILAQHDQSARAVSQVLGEKLEGGDDSPERPAASLPTNLARTIKQFEHRMAKRAKDSPAVIRDGLESHEQDVGESNERVMRSEGDAEDSLDAASDFDSGIIIENRLYTKEKLAYEAFMHEYVLVAVHDTTDDTMAPIPMVCNGGDSQYFIRGKEQWVRRNKIEPLARAKRTTYTQEKRTLANGVDTLVQIPHTQLETPFVVLQDSREGKQWLKNIINER